MASRDIHAHLDHARALLKARTHKVISVDIECYERDQSYMTELGWSEFDPVTCEITSYHDIIKENIRKRNGRFVADNRFRFNFGRSRRVWGEIVLNEFENMMYEIAPCIVVGHDIKSDIRFLRDQNVELPNDVVLFDTKKLYCAYSDNPQNGRKLSVVLDRLGIPHSHLHNAEETRPPLPPRPHTQTSSVGKKASLSQRTHPPVPTTHSPRDSNASSVESWLQTVQTPSETRRRTMTNDQLDLDELLTMFTSHTQMTSLTPPASPRPRPPPTQSPLAPLSTSSTQVSTTPLLNLSTSEEGGVTLEVPTFPYAINDAPLITPSAPLPESSVTTSGRRQRANTDLTVRTTVPPCTDTIASGPDASVLPSHSSPRSPHTGATTPAEPVKTSLAPEGFPTTAEKHQLSTPASGLIRAESVRRESRREMGICEVIKTEQSYLQNLNVLLEVFYLPMREWLDEQDIKIIFGNLEDLMTCSAQLLSVMESQYEEEFIKGTPMRMGEIFMNLANSFDCYGIYCANHGKANQWLEEHSSGNSRVAQFLNKAHEDHRCKHLSFSSFLLQPTQRITRYPLLLKQLLDYTSPSHPDWFQLGLATNMMRGVNEKVNELTRAQGDYDKCQELLQTIDFASAGIQWDPFSEHPILGRRHFIIEGKITKWKSQRVLMFYLFNDVLLLVKTSRLISSSRRELYCKPWPTNHIVVQPAEPKPFMGNRRECFFQLQNFLSNECLLLEAPDVSLARKWRTDISSTCKVHYRLEAQANQRRRGIVKQQTVGRQGKPLSLSKEKQKYPETEPSDGGTLAVSPATPIAVRNEPLSVQYITTKSTTCVTTKVVRPNGEPLSPTIGSPSSATMSPSSARSSLSSSRTSGKRYWTQRLNPMDTGRRSSIVSFFTDTFNASGGESPKSPPGKKLVELLTRNSVDSASLALIPSAKPSALPPPYQSSAPASPHGQYTTTRTRPMEGGNGNTSNLLQIGQSSRTRSQSFDSLPRVPKISPIGTPALENSYPLKVDTSPVACDDDGDSGGLAKGQSSGQLLEPVPSKPSSAVTTGNHLGLFLDQDPLPRRIRPLSSATTTSELNNASFVTALGQQDWLPGGYTDQPTVIPTAPPLDHQALNHKQSTVSSSTETSDSCTHHSATTDTHPEFPARYCIPPRMESLAPEESVNYYHPRVPSRRHMRRKSRRGKILSSLHTPLNNPQPTPTLSPTASESDALAQRGLQETTRGPAPAPIQDRRCSDSAVAVLGRAQIHPALPQDGPPKRYDTTPSVSRVRPSMGVPSTVGASPQLSVNTNIHRPAVVQNASDGEQVQHQSTRFAVGEEPLGAISQKTLATRSVGRSLARTRTMKKFRQALVAAAHTRGTLRVVVLGAEGLRSLDSEKHMEHCPDESDGNDDDNDPDAAFSYLNPYCIISLRTNKLRPAGKVTRTITSLPGSPLCGDHEDVVASPKRSGGSRMMGWFPRFKSPIVAREEKPPTTPVELQPRRASLDALALLSTGAPSSTPINRSSTAARDTRVNSPTTAANLLSYLVSPSAIIPPQHRYLRFEWANPATHRRKALGAPTRLLSTYSVEDTIPASPTNSSDTSLELSEQEQRTHTVYRSRRPKWDETMVFSLSHHNNPHFKDFKAANRARVNAVYQPDRPKERKPRKSTLVAKKKLITGPAGTSGTSPTKTGRNQATRFLGCDEEVAPHGDEGLSKVVATPVLVITVMSEDRQSGEDEYLGMVELELNSALLNALKPEGKDATVAGGDQGPDDKNERDHRAITLRLKDSPRGSIHLQLCYNPWY
ncbi:hypothetical protein IWQ62_002220 [Dispira parvispora]|uniref:DH domain-containing protein n=1 Tax=Dispira parvispora TaxID=1520584 RepID=A0A9W8AQG8_9FUNG|nr:hypothetical protein IWQ62_002220 [Dispira parvispora]